MSRDTEKTKKRKTSYEQIYGRKKSKRQQPKKNMIEKRRELDNTNYNIKNNFI